MKNEFAYIGVKPCGCVPCVAADEEDYRERISELLPEWIKKGMTVEHVTVEEARKRIKRCRCNEQMSLSPRAA